MTGATLLPVRRRQLVRQRHDESVVLLTAWMRIVTNFPACLGRL
jgi:hypothetical protein